MVLYRFKIVTLTSILHIVYLYIMNGFKWISKNNLLLCLPEGEYNNAEDEDDDELDLTGLPEADQVIYHQSHAAVGPMPVHDADASSLASAIDQLTTNGHG